jgi:hypothetical protein
VLDDLKALENYVMDAYNTVGYDTYMTYERDFIFDKVSSGTSLQPFRHVSELWG